ncbi:Spo0E like sporulation regulatory protein [Gracilibacillus orientalis]|uniref:Spo0E like sporulation regulatory protein n=1 Tax=Gracilibacillus orientalis TaxID=334253 RepID=A0A1I4GW24_9BACI|nr:aspartyl-phosphate phosphatase Spo0E family protein [Gracilibacillus orientalis]SFL34165.1 Spo0E like sporulation regulatory protein [Gracilibacillus orientalis]
MGNREIDVELLLERIEVMRRELLDKGFRDGLTAPSTLEYSELLDEYIKVYQKLKKDT